MGGGLGVCRSKYVVFFNETIKHTLKSSNDLAYINHQENASCSNNQQQQMGKNQFW